MNDAPYEETGARLMSGKWPDSAALPSIRGEYDIQAAIELLRRARDLLANAPKTRARVVAALKSADGARRHAQLAPIRAARQGKEGS